MGDYGPKTSVVEVYSMWETGLIGITMIQPSGHVIYGDLCREHAETLIHQLIGACAQFDELERLCKERDGYDELCDHMRSNASGSCARCEGT
jgi:hypothetical protein